MAHAKDKGGSKNTKKKAQKSIQEKRAEKKAEEGSVVPDHVAPAHGRLSENIPRWRYEAG